MRAQPPVIRYLVLLLALVFSTATVAADSRSEAKAHYQAGVKMYNGGDYKGAIKEFSAAQELMPADLNNYNLALCYDKLGDAEPAIQYYRSYIDKQPGTDKRAEIDASISRLENASKAAAAKKEAAAAKEENARKAAEAKAKAEEDRKAAEEAKKRPVDKTPEESKPEEIVGPGVAGGIGSTGTPGGSGTVSTGDAQLDRVQRIDVSSVRDQRVGGASSGMVDPSRGGPSTGAPATGGAAAGGNAAANIDVNAQGGGAATGAPNPNANTANATAPTGQPAAGTPDPADKPKSKPVYKKWWFWAVVAVSAYVVYSIATEDSNDTTSRVLPPMANSPAVGNSGMTLMRW